MLMRNNMKKNQIEGVSNQAVPGQIQLNLSIEIDSFHILLCSFPNALSMGLFFFQVPV